MKTLIYILILEVMYSQYRSHFHLIFLLNLNILPKQDCYFLSGDLFLFISSAWDGVEIEDRDAIWLGE